MENENVDRQSSPSDLETFEQKQCWICFGTDDDDFEGSRDWVSPCKCCGSIQWVHQACVLYWVEAKLKENPSIKAHCPQCNTEYITVGNKVNYIVQVLNKFDATTNRLSPVLACGLLHGVCCSTQYGLMTVIQVMGKQEAIKMMSNINPNLLKMMLQSIPLCLVLGKMINWDETLLLLVQRFTSEQPLLRTIMPSFLYEPVSVSTDLFQSIPTVDKATTICSALLLPTIATIVGRILFGSSSYSNLQKTLLGGLVYIVVNGTLRIYQKQLNAIERRTRIIIDYPESEVEESV